MPRTTLVCHCGASFERYVYPDRHPGRKYYCSYRCRAVDQSRDGTMHLRCKSKERAVPFETRFWAKVRKTDGCWLWVSTANDAGYGLIQRGGRGLGCVLAHRASWEIHNGTIPDGLHVLHHCDNPPCVNPGHLFLGTNHDNIADRVAKGRTTVPGLVGSAHGNAKLTEDIVRQARRRRAAGESGAALSREFEVSKSTMHAALIGKTWTHVG